MKLSLGLSLDARRAGAPLVSAAPPGVFGPAEWNLADSATGGTVSVSIIALPADGGAPISAIEYRVDTGPWLVSGLSGPGSFQIGGLTDGQQVTVVLRARNAAGAGPASAGKTIIPSADPPPTIASVSVNAALGSVDYAGVSEPGTFFALVNGTPAPIAGAEIEALVTAGTALAGVSFPLNSGANSGVLDKSAVPQGSAWLHATVRDSAGNYATDPPVEFTQPAPVSPQLSAPTDAASGQTASSGSVSVNLPQGTLYAVVTTGATAPSAAQVKAGQDSAGNPAAWSGAQAVAGAGTQTLNPAPSGLSAGTAYTTHFMFEDLLGAQSAVASASGFTTDAADPAVRASATTGKASSGSVDVNLPAGIVAGDQLVIAIGHYRGRTLTAPGWTQLGTTVEQPSGINRALSLFHRVADGTEGATVPFTFSGGWSASASVAVAVQDASAVGTPATNTGATGTTHTGPSVTITNAGGMLFTAFLQNTLLSGTGLVAEIDNGSESVGVFASTSHPAAATPTLTATAASAQTWAAASVELVK